MKRNFYLLSLMFIVLFVLVEVSQAGLVNYGRRKGGGPVTQQQRPSEDQSDLPAWKQEWPEVKNPSEDRYDINRDGKLQTAEVKIFLRDVITEVSEKGGAEVNSDILKKYDKNRDGIINRYELTDIRNDVND